jgi:hypothetical protein
MVKQNLTDLKFQKSNAQFKDNRKMLTAMVKGNYTRKEILSKMKSLSDGLKENGKTNSYIGVSMHFAYPNDWTPSLFSSVNNKQILYNPTDSNTTEEYKDIDGLMFYIIDMPEGTQLNQKMHKQKKTQNMFIKK